MVEVQCSKCNESYMAINKEAWEEGKGWVKHYCGEAPLPLTNEERIELFKEASKQRDIQTNYWKTVAPGCFDITDSPDGYMVLYYAEEAVYEAFDRYESLLESANKQCREMDIKERYTRKLKALQRAMKEFDLHSDD